MTISIPTNAMFQWQCQPKAEQLLTDILEECIRANAFIEQLQKDLLHKTSTRLFDWLDHVIVGHSLHLEKELETVGFVLEHTSASYRIFHHPGAQLPRLVIKDHVQGINGLAVLVDSISDFLMVRAMTGHMEGSPLSELRRCCVNTDNDISLWVVERRGTQSIEPTHTRGDELEKYYHAKEIWKTRPRDMHDDLETMNHTLLIAEKMIEMVGVNLAASIALECEREYWQSRNCAGQLQKNRQDQMGMGWANHDHHTFRSSRKLFPHLIRLFEMFGFHCRERFYAGKEAGWGAQIMENPIAKLILFLDVDLLPEEIQIDYRYQELPSRNQLGTIGLWCALHGDSILKGGMHHLEAQFMFDELRSDLEKVGVKMMNPFSNLPYLHQAFTAGEIWPVDVRRIAALEKQNLITKEQAEKFRSLGAIGSHLENLQRREGYKGFNPKNVSAIILQTDPRALGA